MIAAVKLRLYRTFILVSPTTTVPVSEPSSSIVAASSSSTSPLAETSSSSISRSIVSDWTVSGSTTSCSGSITSCSGSMTSCSGAIISGSTTSFAAICADSASSAQDCSTQTRTPRFLKNNSDANSARTAHNTTETIDIKIALTAVPHSAHIRFVVENINIVSLSSYWEIVSTV